MAIFKRTSRENQVCNHIFLLHHSEAGKRLKLQLKMKQIYGKAFCTSALRLRSALRYLNERKK